MLRTKNPCGKVPNQLYLAMDTLADEFGIGTLRLTTRQTFQLHGVLKENLKTLLSDGNKSLYLVFVGVVFSQHLGLLLEQLGQQHLDCFVRTAGQQHLDCF
jgi:hypothetical protein